MEKYGTIPPRFTKEWWAYFWDYYKWHTIATVFAAIIILVTAVQCATQTKYDMSVTLSGKLAIPAETEDAIAAAMAEGIEDCDNNGERNVFIQQLSLSDDASADPQYEMAISTKLMLEFSAGESYLFILTSDIADTYLNSDSCEGLFLPVSEWAQKLPADANVKMAAGVPYAVNLGNSAFFKAHGLDMSNCWLLVRGQRNAELDDEKMAVQYENSLATANSLIAE